MISHKYRVIFVHVPKCAGSSIERYFGASPFKWRKPDYEMLVGWCPDLRIHLQHATARELLENDLIERRVWDDYFKFSFVRNPWSRAVSDFFWMRETTDGKGSMSDYLNASGGFRDLLGEKRNEYYRGDHLTPQLDFLEVGGKCEMDFVGRFENLKDDWSKVVELAGLEVRELPHEKKSKRRRSHYSHYFTKETKDIVSRNYRRDIEEFGYEFEDNRNFLSGITRLISGA